MMKFIVRYKVFGFALKCVIYHLLVLQEFKYFCGISILRTSSIYVITFKLSLFVC